MLPPYDWPKTKLAWHQSKHLQKISRKRACCKLHHPILAERTRVEKRIFQDRNFSLSWCAMPYCRRRGICKTGTTANRPGKRKDSSATWLPRHIIDMSLKFQKIISSAMVEDGLFFTYEKMLRCTERISSGFKRCCRYHRSRIPPRILAVKGIYDEPLRDMNTEQKLVGLIRAGYSVMNSIFTNHRPLLGSFLRLFHYPASIDLFSPGFSSWPESKHMPVGNMETDMGLD